MSCHSKDNWECKVRIVTSSRSHNTWYCKIGMNWQQNNISYCCNFYISFSLIPSRSDRFHGMVCKFIFSYLRRSGKGITYITLRNYFMMRVQSNAFPSYTLDNLFPNCLSTLCSLSSSDRNINLCRYHTVLVSMVYKT